MLYETKGELTIVPEPGGGAPDPELITTALRDAAGVGTADAPGGAGRTSSPAT